MQSLCIHLPHLQETDYSQSSSCLDWKLDKSFSLPITFFSQVTSISISLAATSSFLLTLLSLLWHNAMIFLVQIVALGVLRILICLNLVLLGVSTDAFGKYLHTFDCITLPFSNAGALVWLFVDASGSLQTGAGSLLVPEAIAIVVGVAVSMVTSSIEAGTGVAHDCLDMICHGIPSTGIYGYGNCLISNT